MSQFKKNLFIHADPKRCVGCHSCEIACAVSHSEADDVLGAVALGLKLESRNKVVAVANVVMPMQCRHCEDSPCAVVCPVGAIHHEEAGFVHIIESNCIGCKACSMVCPFGAISMSRINPNVDTSNDRTRKLFALKCDLCYDKMGENNEFHCACVEACPTKALSLIDYDTDRKIKIEKRAKEFAMSYSSIK